MVKGVLELPSFSVGGGMVPHEAQCAYQSDGVVCLRNVFDQILNRTNKLILEADKHKKSIKTYSLSFETSFILEIAKKLLKLLKDKDPLKEKVKLNKFDYFFCFIKSLIN